MSGFRKSVFAFGGGTAEGDGKMRDMLGGKGAGLAEMSRAGLPVPPGFTIATTVCNDYFDNGKQIPEKVVEQIHKALKKLEGEMAQKLGDASNPLLLSVRSGPKFAIPGMMNTILNLGMNDETAEGLARKTANPRFAYDCYRRVLQMFGEAALGVEMEKFDHIFDSRKKKSKTKLDTDLNAKDLQAVIADYKKLVQKETGKPFPQDPTEQLLLSVGAVFGSWWNPKSAYYRKMENIPDNMGTAANVQAMVFGNLDETSGVGVAFTRDPSSGEKVFYGEYLLNAQGEDVVAGIRAPQPISHLAEVMPDAYAALGNIATNLEKHYKDMQDFEFTIEQKRVYITNTRHAKRTGPAAVRIAVELVQEKLISKDDALLRVSTAHVWQHLNPTLRASSLRNLPKLGRGIGSSSGAAIGRLVFSSEAAIEQSVFGPVVLVRNEITPDDIHGMDVSKGVVTTVGGKSSHASVVARGLGRPSVVGMGQLRINENKRELQVETRRGVLRLRQGDWISLDGATGEVFAGMATLVDGDVSKGFVAELLQWADERALVEVRAEADVARDGKLARHFGARGIGLCRTEFMFLEADRLRCLTNLLLGIDKPARGSALNEVFSYQLRDFSDLFTTMDGCPVAIRLLDPILNDLLPKLEKVVVDAAILPYADVRKKKEIATEYNLSFGGLADSLGQLKQQLLDVHSVNPKLGHRGSRFLLTYPEIVEVQARAIFEAAIIACQEGVDVRPEVVVPMVVSVEEFEIQKQIIDRIAGDVLRKAPRKLEYRVGAAIETPRAALTADSLVRAADFLVFAPDHLTQLTMGLSSDDYTKFERKYEELKIFKSDPFAVLDQEGVGKLMKIAIDLARESRPSIEIGAYGQHCGESSSVAFLHQIGTDYVSCSPFTVPMARLAVAQAAILATRKTPSILAGTGHIVKRKSLNVSEAQIAEPVALP